MQEALQRCYSNYCLGALALNQAKLSLGLRWGTAPRNFSANSFCRVLVFSLWENTNPFDKKCSRSTLILFHNLWPKPQVNFQISQSSSLQRNLCRKQTERARWHFLCYCLVQQESTRTPWQKWCVPLIPCARNQKYFCRFLWIVPHSLAKLFFPPTFSDGGTWGMADGKESRPVETPKGIWELDQMKSPYFKN